MTWQQEQIKKIYDETATLITTLGLRSDISWDEMSCLLILLDEVIIKRQHLPLIQLIEEWQRLPPNEEIDELIKNSLFSLDFNRVSSVNETIELMQRLLTTR